MAWKILPCPLGVLNVVRHLKIFTVHEFYFYPYILTTYIHVLYGKSFIYTVLWYKRKNFVKCTAFSKILNLRFRVQTQ